MDNTETKATTEAEKQEVVEPAEVEEKEEAKAAETEEAEKPEEPAESIPKYRLDEVTSKYNDLREQHQRALAYIQAVTQQATQPKPEPVSPEDRVARLETAVRQMYDMYNEQRVSEQEADRTLIAFEAEMQTRPHLKPYSKRIWKDISLEPRRPVSDHFDEWDVFTKQLKKDGAKEAVKPRADVKGYASPTVRGTPPTTLKALDKLKEKKGEDFWDEVNEQFAGHMRAQRSARGDND